MKTAPTPFSVGCRMLRECGKLDFDQLPHPKKNESIIDWLVRAGVSETPQQALAGLLLAANLDKLHAEVMAQLKGGE